MSALRDRFFDFGGMFGHPFTIGLVVVLVMVLAAIPFVIQWLFKQGKVDAKLHTELMVRYKSWLVLIPAIVVPILLGPGWMILGVCVLSLLCYREFARATGLFREKMVSLVVALGILILTATELDHWYRLFVAIVPLTILMIAVIAILRDQPQGYLQRVALGVLAFVLFGSCLGHLAYLANDANYRPIVLLIIVCVELNDVFAFMVGKTFGKRKLAPNTSPNKTIAGSLGSLVLTTLLTVLLGAVVFRGTVLASPHHLVIMGILISILGQFGDLMLSSIKRDIGIKDMAATIPGHGGLLDRFDSLILVSPAMFHYINYFVGVGTEQAQRIFTGG